MYYVLTSAYHFICFTKLQKQMVYLLHEPRVAARARKIRIHADITPGYNLTGTGLCTVTFC